MLLEAQDVGGPITERQVDDIIRETSPRRFWD